MESIAFTLDHYANLFVALFLAVMIGLSFRSNPLRHSGWFTLRRCINWFPFGMLLCLFGILGGFPGGWSSDRFFESRRGPPAAPLSALVVELTLLMAGTAATDFGGRKATAPCSGVVGGCP